MIQDDPTRSDLDAAIDATLPAVTAVSDDVAAASLRRTRIALAEATPGRATVGVAPWRWVVPVVLFTTTALVVGALWRPRTPADTPSRVIADGRPTAPPVALAPLPTTTPVAAASVSAGRVEATRVARVVAPPAVQAPHRDPLAELIAAVQQIPEDAWRASLARTERPVAVPDVPVAALSVNALDTPSISTLPADPIAPGEP